MEATYIQHMGTDLTVVNAARVSFNNDSDFKDPDASLENFHFDSGNLELSQRDQKLIAYLGRNAHWTPFAHPHVTFRITAPIFVARQAFKHKVGFTENEISRRYVSDEPSFHMPTVWRGAPTGGAKQGSDPSLEITVIEIDGMVRPITPMIQEHYDNSCKLYKAILNAGGAPEQARMVLPQAMLTSWYWTGSLAAWARFCNQRMHPHAQAEIQELAATISPVMHRLFPVSWKNLCFDYVAAYDSPVT